MILLRADASKEIGGGHFFRCLAIASFAADAALVVRKELDEGFRAHAARAGVRLIELDSDAMEELAAFEADVIVLDGYQYDATHVAALRERFSGRVAMIDDNGDRDIGAVDLLINPNIHAPDIEYDWSDDTLYLLGPRYALLRPMFAKRREEALPREPWRIFVCVGGSDPSRLTDKVVDALAGGGFELDVVLGPGAEVGGDWGADVTVHRNLEDPSRLMAAASLAVTAAGGMTWELTCLGTPNLQITTAQNQVPLATRMHDRGVTRLLGRSEDIDAVQIRGAVEQLFRDDEQRESMSLAGRALIDGEGAARVARALEGEQAVLRVREAEPHDARNYWLINNHPSVRASSVSTDPIPWDGHVQWFGAKLRDASCLLLVAEMDGVVAGTLRFEGVDTSEAIVSIALDPRFRGAGFGTRIIGQGTERALENAEVIIAAVRPENTASRRAFEKAGYIVEGEVFLDGLGLLRMKRAR